MRFLYTLLLYLLTPLILVFFLTKKGYRANIIQRLGFVPEAETSTSRFWLHAVSVGEVLAAVPLVKSLQQQYPDMELLVTSTTLTGAERARAVFEAKVYYSPLDLPGSIKRFISRAKPQLLIVMETELWPNTIHLCATKTLPVILANGRMSEKSARGYTRFSALSRPVFASLSAVAAQNQQDAKRFMALGVVPEKCTVTGSIKFDLTLTETVKSAAAELKDKWSCNGQRAVLIAASTHRGEDEQLLQALADIPQNCKPLLVIVPRHPERFDSVVDLSRHSGYETARHSTGLITGNTEVVIGDTMGELLIMLGAADIAFVGGTLIENGGHNLIEPAAWGLPIVTGPSLFNFAEIATLLKAEGAMAIVSDAESLAQQVIVWLSHEQDRVAIGKAALTVAEANRGSLGKLMAVLGGSIDQSRRKLVR